MKDIHVLFAIILSRKWLLTYRARGRDILSVFGLCFMGGRVVAVEIPFRRKGRNVAVFTFKMSFVVP